jgi:hypothetical protein
MGNRWSPTVLPTVTRDPFEAGFEGLTRGFGIGTEISERQRRRKLEERQESRADEYLGMQKDYASAAKMSQAIERARSGYSEFEGDPGDPDVIDVPGEYGHINYGRSESAAQHRAQEGALTARKEEERRYNERMQRELEDAIRDNDEARILARSPQAATAMRERAPIAGSDEWKAMKKFETDEAIREANTTGRYRDRSGSSSRDPRAADIARAIDDERARNAQYRSTVRDLRPGMVVMQPSDTAGFGDAQRRLSASDSYLQRLQQDYGHATGVYTPDLGEQTTQAPADPNETRLPGVTVGPGGSAALAELQGVIGRIERSNLPPERKKALKDAAMAEYRATVRRR